MSFGAVCLVYVEDEANMAAKLSFSLAVPKKVTPAPASAPSLRKPAAFGSLDDDEGEGLDAAPTASSSRSGLLDVNRRLAAQNVSTSAFGGSLSRSQKLKLEKERELDPSVFEYDEVYDQMKAAQQLAKAAKEEDGTTKKVAVILTYTFCSWTC
jgi:hypothetical protein